MYQIIVYYYSGFINEYVCSSSEEYKCTIGIL